MSRSPSSVKRVLAAHGLHLRHPKRAGTSARRPFPTRAAYTKGMICEHPWQLPQSGLAEHANFEKTYKKYWNDWDQRNYYTEIHWVAAKAVVETLKAAGPNLTRARLLEVLRRGALDGFDTGFGVKFKQQSSTGGNIFDTEVAVVEITEPSGKPYFYELRQAPAPDPYFTVG